ncbi:MAG: 4-(cytidine 5'-diphospho)-2-C-methyl-D-erythritol kinase [Actinobacteria bacterium]|nr:4-(cytidine 5'-diphospho)-2-C-methyl-D-erythritol kinase [Actinomycetota bacterium]
MASPLVEDEVIRVRASGKINLALRSGPRRSDGYHELATIFQAVSVYDDLEARWDEPGRFSVTMTGDQADLVPCDDSNLAVKAAALLARESGNRGLGCQLTIRKAIPVTGGMAGGSADAAAALLACSVLWDLDADPDDLLELGATLGADVPFCLTGGTALGTGRGDRLAPVLSRGSYYWVLVLNEAELSTPAVFGRFDQLRPLGGGEFAMPPELLSALIAGDPAALGRTLINDLEQAAISLHPELAEVLRAGRELGALGGIVSGSGPTVAFLAGDERAAMELSVGLATHGIGRAIRRVHGPVPGARLLS